MSALRRTYCGPELPKCGRLIADASPRSMDLHARCATRYPMNVSSRPIVAEARAAHPSDEPASVLLVEDDEGLRDSLGDSLEQEGYVVTAVDNGQRALDFLSAAATPPKLILLDLMMPVLDGWELLDRLQENSQSAAIPVIIMTASYRPFLKPRPSGIPVRIVYKPFDWGALLKMVAGLCGRSSSLLPQR